MGVMLDLIASMVVRAAIVYIVLSMNVQLHNLLLRAEPTAAAVFVSS